MEQSVQHPIFYVHRLWGSTMALCQWDPFAHVAAWRWIRHVGPCEVAMLSISIVLCLGLYIATETAYYDDPTLELWAKQVHWAHAHAPTHFLSVYFFSALHAYPTSPSCAYFGTSWF